MMAVDDFMISLNRERCRNLRLEIVGIDCEIERLRSKRAELEETLADFENERAPA